MGRRKPEWVPLDCISTPSGLGNRIYFLPFPGPGASQHPLACGLPHLQSDHHKFAHPPITSFSSTVKFRSFLCFKDPCDNITGHRQFRSSHLQMRRFSFLPQGVLSPGMRPWVSSKTVAQPNTSLHWLCSVFRVQGSRYHPSLSFFFPFLFCY